MAETYELRTVADFLKVPAERRALCLSEFEQWLAIAEIALAVNAQLDPSLAQLEAQTDVFEWIDDDKHEIHLTTRICAAAPTDTPPRKS